MIEFKLNFPRGAWPLLRIYNTLRKRIEEIATLEPGVARMYTCGPTVYRYAHLGNLRSYLMADWIRRVLENQGVQVIHVKNITDVGHMRQEQLEKGGDKVILAALAEGKTPQEIADFYTAAFHRDEAKLNILPAHHFPRATEHIPEMTGVVQRLLEMGYAYSAGGNIYFDVAKYSPYGQLSGNIGGDLMEGTRVERDPLKRDPRDFTLWKRAEPSRTMKWDSPWGEGFPGWHIECSAMSSRYLGEEQDIHTGGVDNVFPHHEDEIAQSEAAFGKPYVRYWVHGQHLLADGVKMAKSVGNEFVLEDIEALGVDPLAFRYLSLTVKYRSRLNLTFSALKASQRALTRLRDRVWEWKNEPLVSTQHEGDIEEWRHRFWNAVNDDLDLPRALSITWAMIRFRFSKPVKLQLLLYFDQVLGLRLDQVPAQYDLSHEVVSTLKLREEHRRRSQYDRADELRQAPHLQTYQIRDTRKGTWARPKTALELQQKGWRAVSSSREVSSYLESPSQVDFSVVVAACNYLDDVKRCVNSALKWSSGSSAEVVAVDNGSTDGTAQWLEETQASDPQVRAIHCDHQLGDAQAKNIGLKQSRGRIVVMLDTSVEVTGDLFSPIQDWLTDPTVGVVGPWGVRTHDLHHFHQEVDSGEADAMQGYCFAFRRDLLNGVGLMRECFRFYRNLDLDFSFQFRSLGYRIMADGTLPLIRHEHRQWSILGEEERDQLSRRNFRHFFKRWGSRQDLLVANIKAHDSSRS